MRRISDRKIIRSDRRSQLPDFREPDVEVSNRNFSRQARQRFARQIVEDADERADLAQIGAPSELKKVDERIIKKGPSTFIDVFIEFDPAPGAEYHEFRVSKIALDEQENGE
jgi:hypothetical protein